MAYLFEDRLTFLGDVYLPRAYQSEIKKKNIVLNLEYPITKSEKGAPNKVNLKSDGLYLKETFGYNPLAVCLANNHISDYGQEGLENTFSILEKNSIQYFGAGSEADNCNNPASLLFNNKTICLLGYVCESVSPIAVASQSTGIRLIDRHFLKKDILTAKEKGADRIVVCFHWGAEEVSAVKRNDIQLARDAVDFGADLVIGHHSHCIQSIEKYNGAYIFYGLGNCIFPDLSVPSMFDAESGVPKNRYIKRQKYWNKESLAVHYCPTTNDVTISKLKFDNGLLKIIKEVSLKNIEDIDLSGNYDKYFKRKFLFGKLRNALFNFIHKPKFPAIRHVKSIIELTKTRKFK
jgi:poly-gamma-glutamate synthesis protein (capsule biosynthesis protein)